MARHDDGVFGTMGERQWSTGADDDPIVLDGRRHREASCRRGLISYKRRRDENHGGEQGKKQAPMGADNVFFLFCASSWTPLGVASLVGWRVSLRPPFMLPFDF